jgi:hypothetical protein
MLIELDCFVGLPPRNDDLFAWFMTKSALSGMEIPAFVGTAN